MKKALMIAPVLAIVISCMTGTQVMAESGQKFPAIKTEETGAVPEKVQHTFDIVALDGAPKPDKTIVTLNNGEQADLNISFLSEGTYQYRITEEEQEDCSCDDSYLVTAQVFKDQNGNLVAIYYLGSKDVKTDSVVFHNTWSLASTIVEYLDENGNIVQMTVVDDGTTSVPRISYIPKKEGYTFVRWSLWTNDMSLDELDEEWAKIASEGGKISKAGKYILVPIFEKNPEPSADPTSTPSQLDTNKEVDTGAGKDISLYATEFGLALAVIGMTIFAKKREKKDEDC